MPPLSEHQIDQVVQRVFGVTKPWKAAIWLSSESRENVVDVEKVWLSGLGVGGYPFQNTGRRNGSADAGLLIHIRYYPLVRQQVNLRYHAAAG
jgi:hypothetical protein